jgi:adenylyltransferase/sulfurtransferase
MNDQQLLRYSRHLLLDEIGIEGQIRIRGTRVLIVGVGGLGSPAALYLVSAGIGHVVLADGDRVDLSNLQRQILHRQTSVGRLKVESGRETLSALNSESLVETVGVRLEGPALEAAVAQVDIVLDCSDRFSTRHAINRACVRLRKPLVSGAAVRFDGQLVVFDSRDPDSPCYECLFPQASDVEEVRCAELGVFAPLTGIIGTMQAAEALKLAGGFGRTSTGELLLLDARDLAVQRIRIPRDPECLICGKNPRDGTTTLT